MGRPKLTDEQRSAQRREALDKLQAQTEALLTSDGWRGWLRTRAMLHRYSANNALFLFAQSLERDMALTHVAGFQAWLRLGRCVRKGETALKVFAPMPVRRRDDEDRQNGEDKEERPRVLFRLSSVFDVSQTDPLPDTEPTPLAPPFAPLTGDSHAHLLAPLTAFAAEIGYPVVFGEDPRAYGTCDHRAKRIELRSSTAPNQQAATLIHELAHALLGPNSTAYAIEEVTVEATAYIVASAAGLDSSDAAVPYISSWGGDDPVAQIKATVGQIDALASRLQAVIEPHVGPPEPAVEALAAA